MEETGLPYERVLTDITTGAQKAPEYLAINPMGKVPALKDGDARSARPRRSAPISPTAIPKPSWRRALDRSVARKISAMDVLLAELHRARD